MLGNAVSGQVATSSCLGPAAPAFGYSERACFRLSRCLSLELFWPGLAGFEPGSAGSGGTSAPRAPLLPRFVPRVRSLFGPRRPAATPRRSRWALSLSCACPLLWRLPSRLWCVVISSYPLRRCAASRRARRMLVFLAFDSILLFQQCPLVLSISGLSSSFLHRTLLFFFSFLPLCPIPSAPLSKRHLP